MTRRLGARERIVRLTTISRRAEPCCAAHIVSANTGLEEAAMKKTIMISAALLSAFTFSIAAAPPSFAQRSGYYDSHHHWHSYRKAPVRARTNCERDRQRASNKGAVVGGIGGAVLGGAVAGRGAKTEGAVLGGLGGVLAGRQIAKKDHRC
jgi:hypothetical protein